MGEKDEYTPPDANPVRKGSSPRLMWGVEKQVRFMFGNVEVAGKDHLEQLSSDTRVIFATTHISDNDVPITVAALGHDFDLAVADTSIHRNWIQALKSFDPTIIGIKIAGKDNFLSITGTQKKGIRKSKFVPDDMENIKAALDRGKAVIVAAHNPNFDGKLPPNPGLAAVRVAQLAGESTVVIPVAVQIGEPSEVLGLGNPKNVIETRRRRPKVKVAIGEPLKFDDPEAKQAADTMEELLGRWRQGIRLSSKDRRRFATARRLTQQEGAKLMKSLAVLLPPEKRGVWKEHAPDSGSSNQD